MGKFYESDYALNKNSKDILYRSIDGTITRITLAIFLAESPTSTEEDFLLLKNYSDNMYRIEANKDRNEERTIEKIIQTSPKDSVAESVLENMITKEMSEEVQQAFKILLLSGALTDKQKKRFIAHFIYNLSYRQIAENEGVHFTSVQESILACSKKLKKILKTF